jgi:CubicO group peptidase (beta-lactamase class C family)
MIDLIARTHALAIACVAAAACHGGRDRGPRAEAHPELDQYITEQMERGHIPGLAAAIVRRGEVAWAGAYGLADIETRRRVTPDTLFMLASLSKSITATAVMQLVDDGKLDLDADIDRYLPFEVRNPKFPDVAITARELLTHTSSIADDEDRLLAMYVDGDARIELAALVRGYLVPGGPFYDPARNFKPTRPGQAWEYCNYCYALLGYLVEQVSGSPFDAFTRARIFTPLGMNETSWFLRDLDVHHVATPYTWTSAGPKPHMHYGYPDYPDGQLRTSLAQLARYFAAEINGGAYHGHRIVSARALAEMQRDQLRGLATDGDVYGLGWFQRNGAWGHTGGDTGVTNAMFFRPRSGVGVILLTNGGGFQDPTDAAAKDALRRIEDRLFREAEVSFGGS